MAKKKTWNRRTRRFWVRTVSEWRESGQSLNAFAEARGLAPSTLGRWARTLPKEPGVGSQLPSVVTPSFVEVVAESGAPASPELKLRMLVGGAVAEFPELPPPEYVAAIGLHAEGARC